MKNIIGLLQKVFKESGKESFIWIQSLALFVCVLFAVYLGDTAIEVSSTYGNRELPIYCVETEEKKVAISFDAAWGAVGLLKKEILQKYNRKVRFEPLIIVYVYPIIYSDVDGGIFL